MKNDEKKTKLEAKPERKKGFAAHPWLINRTGQNRGCGWKKKTIEMLNNSTLEITVIDAEGKKRKLYSRAVNRKNKEVSLTEAILAMQTIKALKGDSKAVELLRDTSGETPTQKLEVNGENQNNKLMKIDLSRLTDSELDTWEKLFEKVTKDVNKDTNKIEEHSQKKGKK